MGRGHEPLSPCSPLRHPGVLEGDKDQVEPLQLHAVELGIELIGQLLLQLTVILLCIYLGQEAALRAGGQSARTALLDAGTCSLSSMEGRDSLEVTSRTVEG